MFSSQCGASGAKSNSGIGVRDFAALEFMKELVGATKPEDADELARESFVFANAYMAEKERNR